MITFIGTALYLSYPNTFGGIYGYQIEAMNMLGPLIVPAEMILTSLFGATMICAPEIIDSLKGRLHHFAHAQANAIAAFAQRALAEQQAEPLVVVRIV